MGWRAVWAAAAVLMIVDAVLTYISVGHLGAVEVVLRPINDFPPLVFAVTVAKIGGLYYLYAKRYGWLNYAVLAILMTHATAVTNDLYWLFYRLSCC